MFASVTDGPRAVVLLRFGRPHCELARRKVQRLGQFIAVALLTTGVAAAVPQQQSVADLTRELDSSRDEDEKTAAERLIQTLKLLQIKWFRRCGRISRARVRSRFLQSAKTAAGGRKAIRGFARAACDCVRAKGLTISWSEWLIKANRFE